MPDKIKCYGSAHLGEIQQVTGVGFGMAAPAVEQKQGVLVINDFNTSGNRVGGFVVAGFGTQ